MIRLSNCQGVRGGGRRTVIGACIMQVIVPGQLTNQQTKLIGDSDRDGEEDERLKVIERRQKMKEDDVAI